MPVLGLVVVIICIALVFDFVNGFHDAANSVATVVATRVLTPFQAVGLAAAFNFLAAFFLGTGVASTVGNGFVNTNIVTPYVLMAGLIGAVIWNLLTWYVGLAHQFFAFPDWRLCGRCGRQGRSSWFNHAANGRAP